MSGSLHPAPALPPSPSPIPPLPPPPRPKARPPPPPRHIAPLKKKSRDDIGTPNNQQVAAAIPIRFANPIRRDSPMTIVRFSAILPSYQPSHANITSPTAVAIGPYHHGSPKLLGMEAVKTDAVKKFCEVVANQTLEVASQTAEETPKPREAALLKIKALAETIRSCYNIGDEKLTSIDDGELSEMMLRDGCFLLQFMQKVGGDNNLATSNEDIIYTRMGAITRDILLVENQIPWVVVQTLMELGNLDSESIVDKFLGNLANVFHVGGRNIINTNTKASSDPVSRGAVEGAPTASPTSWRLHLSQMRRMRRMRDEEQAEDKEEGEEDDKGDVRVEGEEAERKEEEPQHLLAIFHRHHVGKARTQGACLYILPSLGSSAVELAEMGVKLTATKTKKFGDMEMKKRRWPLGLFGELSLAPLALDQRTACWMLNMVAYEAFLGATRADNFAVSSYIFLVAHLINREEDVQDLRARGIISSAMSDGETLKFFKSAAPSLRIGDRYIEIAGKIQEYTKERWIWIAIHSFIYNNFKIIIAVLSVVGVLAGLFKTIMSLKQSQRN
ncbi:unnamed protein product [Urochloa humidicola]